MKTNHLLVTWMLISALLLSAPLPAAAETGGVALGEERTLSLTQARGPTDALETEAFMDDLFAQQMEENQIAGAAVAVVKDGKLFFAKGYGYADLEKSIPVDPETTIFRIGSVGKVITWTAVMQLVEQGRLDLDAEINTYLDFRIPDTYPQPITLRHLLTHTSGFEDRWFGSAASDANGQVPEREWLVSPVWARVRPPGDAGYSNFNAILAGYIVARVSGQPYDQYIQEQIFDPLGMVHSTARSQIPAELGADASVGYVAKDGNLQALPEYTAQPALLPSGGHRASVTDMARFLIAHLEGGRYSDTNIPEARILKESTCLQMHSTLYTPDSRLRGTTYGLFDWTENGQWTLGHSGYSPPMHSVLLMLPDQNLGVFVAYNSQGGGNLTSQHSGFQKAFFDHYYPAPAVEPLHPPADFAKRADRFTGSYNASSSYTTLVKITGLFGGGYTVQIRNPGDGTLLFSLEGIELRFVEVEPFYFRQIDGPFAMVFREDDRGRITHLFTDLMPQYATVKLAWYETSGFNLALLLGSLLLFLAMIPIAVIRLMRNRHTDADRRTVSRGARRANWIILGICLLNLLFVVGFAVGMPEVEQNILLDPPWIMKFVLGVGAVSALLTAGALVYTVLAWKESYWGLAYRTYYTLATIAAIAFVWFLNYWNLLGWRY